jgi:hypothetical protein
MAWLLLGSHQSHAGEILCFRPQLKGLGWQVATTQLGPIQRVTDMLTLASAHILIVSDKLI